MAEKQKFQGFFSYAHVDGETDQKLIAALTTRLALRVTRRLINAEFTIWHDVKLRTGQQWDDRIGQAVRESKALIVLMTPKWFESTYCRKEYQIFKQVEDGLGAREYVVPILAYSLEDQLLFFDDEQRATYDELDQRQYRKSIAATFLALTEDQREVLTDEIADDIEKMINRLRPVPRAPQGYEPHLRAGGDGVAPVPVPVTREPDKPAANPSDILLVKGPSRAPEVKITGLASVELFPAQVGRGTADIGFDLSCGIACICGLPVRIRMGEMRWDCGGGQLDPKNRIKRTVPYRPNDGVKLTWNGGNTFAPGWRVEAEAGSIGNLSVPPDFDKLIGLDPGCSVTATFGVWRPNIEEFGVSDSTAVIAAFDTVAILADVDPAAMSVLKKRIIVRLATDVVARDDANFIELCRHTVTFVAPATE